MVNSTLPDEEFVLTLMQIDEQESPWQRKLQGKQMR